MAKYTTTIYRLKLNNFDFGLQEYPIFDEDYRDVLNKKILDHYLMEEIGFETAAAFKHFLNARMNEIMPKYNIMYQAQMSLQDKWNANVDITKTRDRTEDNTANRSNTITSSGNSRALTQDTPQGSIKTTKKIDDANYATQLNMSESEASDITNEQGNGQTTEHFVETVLGNNGRKYAIELYSELARGIINIDQLIINDLATLFMGVY